jgi:cation diffusion facilitator CzcD-associated flavoprotein CzcO
MDRPLDIVIIGAGMSGLFLGHKLRESGRSFTILEKAHEVGGTWRDNTYPGLHVDVITRSYEFPFARSRHWSRRYSPGSEVRSYLNDVATRCDIQRSIRFGVEVESAVYDDGRWTVTSTAGETWRADVVFAGTGFLHRPVIPNIPGRATFAGAAFHSARWDHSVDLVGKRVGVLGTGSSGIQIVSALGQQGVEVTQFLRNPHWIQVKENPAITPQEKVLLGVPFLSRFWDWRMRRLKIRTDGSEEWKLRPGPEREAMTKRFLEVLEDQIADPELRAKLTPTDALGCKRIPKSPDYYSSVQLPNVHLSFGQVQRIEADGVVDAEGALHELDVIVFATGFDSHAYMRPMEVVGEGGVSVNELWNDFVYSYRGVALPHMPNFFLLSGPFAPVNSLAVPASLEDESRFLLAALAVIERDAVAMCPTDLATRTFLDDVSEAAEQTTFALCDNWYRDRGSVPILWPWGRERHRQQFERIDLSEFELFPLGAGEERRVSGQV